MTLTKLFFQLPLIGLWAPFAFFGLSASAMPNRSNLKPLFFQADKNNVQVLAQRFEYSLEDENRIRIGDIMIDGTKLNFQLVPTENKGFKLKFQWPAGLLLEGNILIKDNSGKAIFSSKIDKEVVSVGAKDNGGAGDDAEGLRSESAEYTSPEISANLLEDMRFLPYMNFCVFRQEAHTRIYLCSKELYLSTDKTGDTIIKSRSATQRKAQVEINGRVVGNQGIIFLNDPSENLVLKAFSQSGSTLEIETRLNAVDFKDVVSSDDHKFLILTASGTEPVDPRKVKRMNKDEWRIRLPVDRPFVYLKGDGDIPMRQEFLVKGELPSEKMRPYLTRSSISRTYSSSVSLTGYAQDASTLTTDDKEAELKNENGGEFRWNLNNISTENKNRRYLTIKSGNKTTVAGYDVFRGKPFELGVAGKYLLPSGLIYGDLHFSWWLEDFLLINTPLTHLHWGIDVDQQQHLTSKDGEVKADTTNVELMYRFNSGFYQEDETWGLSLPYQVLKTDAASLTLLGLGIFAQKRPPEFAQNWMSWYNAKFDYFFSSSGSDFKVKQAYKLDFVAYRALSTKSWFLNYGLGLSQYKFDPSAAKENMQLNLTAGVAYRF